MTTPTDRDPALGQAIDRLAVPDHTDGFWDDLRDGLRTAGSDTEDVGPEAVHLLDPTARHRSLPWLRPRTSLVLVSAAALAVIAAAVTVAVRVDDPSQSRRLETADTSLTAASIDAASTTTSAVEPAPSPSSTIDTARGVLTGAAGEVIELGSGQILGLSPGGEVAYVADEDPEFDGNECASGSVYLQRVGEMARVRAGGPGEIPTGWGSMSHDGRIFQILSCEGSFGGLWVGRLGPDLVPVQQRVVDLRVSTLAPSLDYLTTLNWTADRQGSVAGHRRRRLSDRPGNGGAH